MRLRVPMLAAEARIVGAIDFTHPAGAEDANDFVRSWFVAGFQRHVSPSGASIDVSE